jgi:ankyrin repeat protein
MNAFDAARSGNDEVLRRLLTSNNVNNATVVDSGWTPLMYAARGGHCECVKVCLEMGANVNA